MVVGIEQEIHVWRRSVMGFAWPPSCCSLSFGGIKEQIQTKRVFPGEVWKGLESWRRWSEPRFFVLCYQRIGRALASTV